MEGKLARAYTRLEDAWEREKDGDAETVEDIEVAMQIIEDLAEGGS